MTKEVVVVARLWSAKGNGDALAAFLVEQAAAIKRAEPGCLMYRVHRSANDPELFLFYEKYATRGSGARRRCR
jgi:quinol monooxygenase YgiN